MTGAAAVAKLVETAKRYEPPRAPRASQREVPERPPSFDVVPFADLAHSAPTPPLFAWEGLVPLEHVTIFGAHGGTGKTITMLTLAVCAALGRPLFGIPTRQANVVFFSGEDGANRLRFLLHFVCRSLDVRIEELAGKLHLLDAASHDPTLFAEVSALGQREGQTTAAYTALREFLDAQQAGLVIVDNASDVFGGSEIARAQVRGFMRSLAKVARELQAAVILLAHVDKGTSRQERTGTEGYSGSTAWHNSARSRLFMRREQDGSLLIEHQKHNLGSLHAPIRLIWPEGGIPQLDVQFGPVVQGIEDRGHERALLRLIEEYSARGEHVPSAHNGRPNAPRMLCEEPTYPKRLKDTQVLDLLRKCQRSGLLEVVTFKGADRKDRQRWSVTELGRSFAGLPAASAASAASAVSAVSTEHAADTAQAASPAASAACTPSGGMGGLRAQPDTAEGGPEC